jgi:hypothetical protein
MASQQKCSHTCCTTSAVKASRAPSKHSVIYVRCCAPLAHSVQQQLVTARGYCTYACMQTAAAARGRCSLQDG